jgi:hypothetical protein
MLMVAHGCAGASITLRACVCTVMFNQSADVAVGAAT